MHLCASVPICEMGERELSWLHKIIREQTQSSVEVPKYTGNRGIYILQTVLLKQNLLDQNN